MIPVNDDGGRDRREGRQDNPKRMKVACLKMKFGSTDPFRACECRPFGQHPEEGNGKGLLEVRVTDLRDFTYDRHNT
jgi:hypothetical protein